MFDPPLEVLDECSALSLVQVPLRFPNTNLSSKTRVKTRTKKPRTELSEGRRGDIDRLSLKCRPVP